MPGVGLPEDRHRRRCSGSRPRTSPGRSPRAPRIGGRGAAGRRTRCPAVHRSHRRGRRAAPAGRRAALPDAAPDGTGETIMGAMLARLAGKARPRTGSGCRRWPNRRPLDELLPPLAVDPAARTVPRRAGRATAGWSSRRRSWTSRSSSAATCCGRTCPAPPATPMVVGAPQSGKSTLLRTLVCALALTHTPREVQFFLLDMGGGALATVSGLPHVSGVRQPPRRGARAGASSPRSTTLLTEREQLFARRTASTRWRRSARRRPAAAVADGRRVRRRVPGHRRLDDAAPGVRGAGGARSPRSPPAAWASASTWCCRPAGGWSMRPPLRDMHRHPVRAAAGRSGRLGDRPPGRAERARRPPGAG